MFHCCITLLFNSDKDVFYANDLTAKNLNKDVCFDSGKNVEGHFTPLTPKSDWYVISPYNFSIRPSGQMIRIAVITVISGLTCKRGERVNFALC